MTRPSIPWAALLAAILSVSAVGCQKKQESPPVPNTNAQAPSPAPSGPGQPPGAAGTPPPADSAPAPGGTPPAR